MHYQSSLDAPVGETSRSRCSRSAGACPPRWFKRRYFHRSAGACPPRLLGCTNDGEGQALALRWRGRFFYRSAGACPPRTLKRRYFHRSAGACPPRSLSSRCVPPSVVCDRLITNRSGSGAPELQSLARERWRGTGPRPTVPHAVFSRRRAFDFASFQKKCILSKPIPLR